MIKLNPRGVNSAFFEPGPYAPMEMYARCYSEWYLAALRDAVQNTPTAS